MRIAVIVSFVVGMLTVIGLEALAPDTRKISLPNALIAVSDSNDHLHLQGTWRLTDHESAFPLQTTTMTCNRGSMECISASAVMGTPRSMFPVKLERLKVLSWDVNSIVLEGEHSTCVYHRYVVDLDANSAVGLRVRKNKNSITCGEVGSDKRLVLDSGRG